MRPARQLWCVTNPGPLSELHDCVFRTTVAGFMIQVKGGLSEADRPELHQTYADAIFDLAERVEAAGPKGCTDGMRHRLAVEREGLGE